jgi:hypothetical protein
MTYTKRLGALVLLLAALLLGGLLIAVPSASAHYGTKADAEAKYRSSNYAGACGAGATFYCAQKNSEDCGTLSGNHYRKCVGYYVRGPGWPVTSKIHCRTSALYDHDHNSFSVLSNECWA